jgi:hypothetical protein
LKNICSDKNWVSSFRRQLFPGFKSFEVNILLITYRKFETYQTSLVVILHLVDTSIWQKLYPFVFSVFFHKVNNTFLVKANRLVFIHQNQNNVPNIFNIDIR